VDDVITYIYTTLNSIPGVLLIASAVLISQVWMDGHPDMFETVSQRADLRLLFLCLILGITTWTGLCRLLRGEALKLREMDYVQAARMLGANNGRILLRHGRSRLPLPEAWSGWSASRDLPTPPTETFREWWARR